MRTSLLRGPRLKSPLAVFEKSCRRQVIRPSAAFIPFDASSTSGLSSNCQRRSFHIDSQACFSAAQSTLQTAQDAIISIHTLTGLSWGFTIPLVALGVNLIFRLPFNVQSQIIIQRRSMVASLQQAWFMKLWREAVRENVPANQMKKVVEKRAKSQTKRLYRSMGLQQWKMFSVLLGVPFWLMTLESIRRISGWSRGNISGAAAVDYAPNVGDIASAVTAGTTPDASSLPILPKNTIHTESLAVEGNITALPAVDHVENAAQALDPTLATEGMLWFADLTAADPYYILPVCFAALTAANIIPKDSAGREAILRPFKLPFQKKQSVQTESSSGPPAVETVQDEGWRVRTVRAVLFASPVLVFLTASFPAAMHLYTLTSLVTTMVTRAILSKAIPMQARLQTFKHREMPVIRPPIQNEKSPSKGVST